MAYQILIQALVLGLVIAALERDGFPDLVPLVMSICSIILATLAFQKALPDGWSNFGAVLGGIYGAYIISWVCKVSFQRGLLIAGVYLGITMSFRVGLQWLMHA